MCGALPLGAWRTSLVVDGLDPTGGERVPVVVGLVDTGAGGVQLALKVGTGRPVLLALQGASQLASNLAETTVERLVITAEALRPSDT